MKTPLKLMIGSILLLIAVAIQNLNCAMFEKAVASSDDLADCLDLEYQYFLKFKDATDPLHKTEIAAEAFNALFDSGCDHVFENVLR